MHKLNTMKDTRMGLFTILVFLFWLKTLLAYFVDFRLGAEGVFQYFILLINPIATTIFMFGLAFYFKRSRFFYPLGSSSPDDARRAIYSAEW